VCEAPRTSRARRREDKIGRLPPDRHLRGPIRTGGVRFDGNPGRPRVSDAIMKPILTLRRAALLAGLAILAGSVLFCSPGYILRAGVEEAKILSRRQPIDQVIDAPETGEATRAKLELVRSARTFAAEELELDVGDSYTTFSQLDRDTLLMLVTAAPKVSFTPYTWWFPIVGRVPYKGFFDPADAEAEAARLEAEGYDTHLRPSGAFSTLGWFNDPLLSTVLDYDDVALASTVIHEVTHNTTFIGGQVAFNESFANFVGDVGAVEYFCSLEGDDGRRCRYARARWHDDVLFARALQRLVHALQNVYQDPELAYEEKVRSRDEVIRRWRAGFQREVVPELQVAFTTFHERPINNASLMGLRLYYDRLDLFDHVYRSLDRPLREVVARMIDAAESSPDDPFGAVERLAAP
jgi:predicted aminopeptidase